MEKREEGDFNVHLHCMEEGGALMWRSDGHLLVKWVGTPSVRGVYWWRSPDVVEQAACIHWWPCSGVDVPT